MSRHRRLVALALLHALVLALGVGVAAAHEGGSRGRVTAAPVPPVEYAPVMPSPRPSATPARPAPRRTVKPKPKPKPEPAATATATPRATHRTTARVHRAPAPAPTQKVARSTSFHDRLMQAVSRIPGYRAGEAEWIVKPDLGSWGLAAMGGGTVYVSPDVPADKLYDVVAHEWSHILVVKVYGGDLMSALAAVNGYFGGADLVGAERAADCMARVLGATWTHYTSCSDSHWRDGARRLVSRQRL
jgi:hypothetical protein